MVSALKSPPYSFGSNPATRDALGQRGIAAFIADHTFIKDNTMSLRSFEVRGDETLNWLFQIYKSYVGRMARSVRIRRHSVDPLVVWAMVVYWAWLCERPTHTWFVFPIGVAMLGGLVAVSRRCRPGQTMTLSRLRLPVPVACRPSRS